MEIGELKAERDGNAPLGGRGMNGTDSGEEMNQEE